MAHHRYWAAYWSIWIHCVYVQWEWSFIYEIMNVCLWYIRVAYNIFIHRVPANMLMSNAKRSRRNCKNITVHSLLKYSFIIIYSECSKCVCRNEIKIYLICRKTIYLIIRHSIVIARDKCHRLNSKIWQIGSRISQCMFS